jgi:acetylornithine deacetylase/succinyl-diaminopimelate desuccinylase-like protein
VTALGGRWSRAPNRMLAESVAELVRIPSVNPLHGGPVAASYGPIGEEAIGRQLAERCSQLGAESVVLDEVGSGRLNLYATFPGRTDRLVVVDVHTDTVTVENMTDPPFDGRIDDEFVWGRGALDSKATLGVLLALLAAWRRDQVRPDPTLMVVATVGEEAGGLLGATRFRRWAIERELSFDQILVAEPTGFRPVHGLKGLVLLRVTAQGVSAHAARPELGVNAIEAMAPVISAFVAEGDRLATLVPATELGNGTVSVTGIEGGSGSNVIPDSCSITVGRRLTPGEEPADVIDALSAVARTACPVPCRIDSLLPVTPDGKPGTPAFYQGGGAGLVHLLARACGTTSTVAPFGANALRYNGLARELVVFGPGSIDLAHQPTERIARADLDRLAVVLEEWLSPT